MSGSEETTTLRTLLDQEWFPRHMLEQLDAEDAIRLCRATRLSHSHSALRLLPPMPALQPSASWHSDPSQYSAVDWQPLEPAGALRVHTTIIRCEWKDQGWGNRKGMLSVVRGTGKAPNDHARWGPDVMCGKAPAPHDWTPLELTFRPAADDTSETRYRLWARAGGGGGHSLHVRELSVRELVFVDSPAALEEWQRVARMRRGA